jgi:hypothetical protein
VQLPFGYWPLAIGFWLLPTGHSSDIPWEEALGFSPVFTVRKNAAALAAARG